MNWEKKSKTSYRRYRGPSDGTRERGTGLISYLTMVNWRRKRRKSEEGEKAREKRREEEREGWGQPWRALGIHPRNHQGRSTDQQTRARDGKKVISRSEREDRLYTRHRHAEKPGTTRYFLRDTGWVLIHAGYTSRRKVSRR